MLLRSKLIVVNTSICNKMSNVLGLDTDFLLQAYEKILRNIFYAKCIKPNHVSSIYTF